MSVTLLLVSSAIVLFIVFWTWNFNYWKNRRIPGPKPSLIFGNTKSYMFKHYSLITEFHNIYKKYKGNHPFVGIYSLRTPQVLITDSELVKDVLIRNFKNFYDNEVGEMTSKKIDPLMARNPFFMKGTEWKEARSEITPAFSPGKIKAFYPVMESVCQKMTIFIRNELKKEPKDGIHIRDVTARFTTDIVTNCIFGLDSDAFSAPKVIMQEMAEKWLNEFGAVVNFFIYTAAVPMLKKLYKFNIMSKQIGDFFVGIMENAIKHRETNKTNQEDFLSFLLQLRHKKGISLIDMTAHGLTFFLDGYETSSIAMAYTLCEIGLDSRVQKKLRDEIQEALKINGNVTYDILMDLPYLDQVVNESLRLHSPIIMLSKQCVQTFQFHDSTKNRLVEIPKGIVAHIPVYSIHHDGNHFPNPDEFNPERFDEEHGGVKVFKDKGVFIPFGDGPRICLGMKFAIAQMKACIFEIVKNFEITVNPKTKVPIELDANASQFFTYPLTGLWLNLKPIV